MGEGTVRESGMDVDARLCLPWRTSKDLLASPGNSAQYSVISKTGKEFEKEPIRVSASPSHSAGHLKLSPQW